MRLKKTLIVTALSLFCTLVLFGCGKKNSEATLNKDAIYKESSVDIEITDFDYVNSFSYKDGKLYLMTSKSDPVTYESTPYWIVCNEDGSDFKSFKIEGTGWGDRLLGLGNGKVLMCFSEYYEDASDPDNYIWENYYYGIILDETTGKETKRVDLTKELGISYMESLMVLDNGQILCTSNNTLYLINDNLEIVKQESLPDNTWINSFVKIKDGSLVVNCYQNDENELCKFDANNLKIGEKIECPLDKMGYGIMNGNGTYDILYRDSTSIYGINLGDAQGTELCNFIDSDIDFNGGDIHAFSDGNFLSVTSNWGEDGKNKVTVSKYVKVDPSEVKEKEIITLGCLYINSDIKRDVINFNKESDEYRIKIVDYSIYNNEEDWDGGSKKFNSDIASGKGTDIIAINSPETVHNLSKKGLFEDLYPYIDNDPDIDRNDMWPNILEALEIDGKLCELVPYFDVQTLLAKKSVVGDRSSWTLKEMMDFEKTLPEDSVLMMNLTRDEFVSTMVSINCEDFVNMSEGTCSFDKEGFKTLITYAKNLPVADDAYYQSLERFYTDYESLWRQNKVILYPATISNPSDYKYIIHGYFGEDVSFIGYPSENGNGSSFSYYFGFAINSKCKSKDAAWSFIRKYLDKDYVRNRWGVPMLMSIYDEQLKEAMERPYYYETTGGTEEKVYYDDFWYANGQEIPLDPLNEQETKQLKDFILSVTKTQGSLTDDLRNIIDEEVAAYYEGQKSIDEVCDIIQSRASLYIKEQQ